MPRVFGCWLLLVVPHIVFGLLTKSVVMFFASCMDTKGAGVAPSSSLDEYPSGTASASRPMASMSEIMC